VLQWPFIIRSVCKSLRHHSANSMKAIPVKTIGLGKVAANWCASRDGIGVLRADPCSSYANGSKRREKVPSHLSITYASILRQYPLAQSGV